MNIGKYLEGGSHLLAAKDIEGKGELKLIIERVAEETLTDLNGKTDQVAVMYFKGCQKGMKVNKTNGGTIVNQYGAETDDWIGREIILYWVPETGKGPGIRVRFPPAVQHQAVDENEVPF